MECPLCCGTGECIIQIDCHDCNGDPSTCPCPICFGKGEITGEFHGTTKAVEVLGIVNYGKLLDILTKLDALETKIDTIDTHLDTIETKIDAL